MAIKLKMVEGRYGIAQLPAGAAIPDWAVSSGFWAAIGAPDETTLVCPQNRIPQDVTATRDWACLRTIGPFEFDQAGVVRNLISPISDADIGVFVVCTYDGEHVLVPTSDLPRVQCILVAAGYVFDD